MLGVPAAPSGTAELPAKALNGATRISNAAAKCFYFKAVQERNGRAASAAGFKPPSRHVLLLPPVSRVLGRVLGFFPPAKSNLNTFRSRSCLLRRREPLQLPRRVASSAHAASAGTRNTPPRTPRAYQVRSFLLLRRSRTRGK